MEKQSEDELLEAIELGNERNKPECAEKPQERQNSNQQNIRKQTDKLSQLKNKRECESKQTDSVTMRGCTHTHTHRQAADESAQRALNSA